MISTNELGTLPGTTVYGSDGEKIGRAGQAYVDDQSGQPEWVTVNTGLFGTKETFVPLQGAQLTGEGLTVPYTKDHVKDAPNVDPENGHLDEAEEQRLFQHYEVGNGAGNGSGYAAEDYAADDYATDGQTDTAAGGTGFAREGVEESAGAVGHDTSGPTTDDAMTRSEEQLRVGTESREAGRARLRKYVVTEQQNVQVPVTREEVTLEREPITDANAGDAMDGPAISEEEHEVVLHEEKPVVDKEAVPVERVRLGKEQVTDQQTVSEEVRQERIETEGPGLTDERG